MIAVKVQLGDNLRVYYVAVDGAGPVLIGHHIITLM